MPTEQPICLDEQDFNRIYPPMRWHHAFRNYFGVDHTMSVLPIMTQSPILTTEAGIDWRLVCVPDTTWTPHGIFVKVYGQYPLTDKGDFLKAVEVTLDTIHPIVKIAFDTSVSKDSTYENTPKNTTDASITHSSIFIQTPFANEVQIREITDAYRYFYNFYHQDGELPRRWDEKAFLAIELVPQRITEAMENLRKHTMG